MASTSHEQMSDSLISSDENRRMFNKIAHGYDLANRLMSLGLDSRWRRRAAQMLRPATKKRYLDIGCGTGDVTLEILRQSPFSEVVGLDPAEKMLEIAQRRIVSENADGQTELVEGDAVSLKFEDSSFDGIISAFCIRNITDRRKALSEMHRTLTGGSPVVLLELTAPTSRMLRPAYSFYSRCIIPMIGSLAGDSAAYRYLVRSIDDFTQHSGLEDIMRDEGFINVRTVPMTCGAVTIFYGERAQS